MPDDHKAARSGRPRSVSVGVDRARAGCPAACIVSRSRKNGRNSEIKQTRVEMGSQKMPDLDCTNKMERELSDEDGGGRNEQK